MWALKFTERLVKELHRLNVVENGAPGGSSGEVKKRSRKSTPQKLDGPHKCEHCEKEFENRRALKRHEKNHTQEKTFPCTVCLKMFKTKAQREEHIASHVTDSEFKCDQCPYVAKRIKYLRYHMKKHRKEYSAYCEPCQEGFFSRDKLETHNIAKHGAQPYQCETCRKLFLSKYSLFTHNKKHLPIEERLHYQCELCGKSFNNKQTFSKFLLNITHQESSSALITPMKAPKAQNSIEQVEGSDVTTSNSIELRAYVCFEPK
ncbi:hypothetical protein M8J77_013746 [Diaphorina citri]|nr:hypothetical protein M8J77_013746 [Diaphorina citri]